MGKIMLLASRAVRLGDLTKSLAWAIEITQAIQAQGGPTTLWQGLSGTEVGSVVWSTAVEDFAGYVAFGDGLANNADFVRLVAEAGDHIESVQPDGLVEVIHGVTGETKIGGFASVVNANAGNGQWSSAGAWAVSISMLVTEITGITGIVTAGRAGPMGSFGWITVYDDAAAMDAAFAKTAADPRYMESIDSAATMFLPGASTIYARRVA